MTALTRIISLLFYTLLIALIVIVATLQGIAIWLSSSSGEDWVRSQAVTVASGAGYDLQLGDMTLAFMGVSIADISVQSDDGLNIAAEDVVLRLNPFPLTFKILNVTLGADRLAINGLPEGQEEATERNDPFILPDIFFNKINVKTNIKSLTLPDKPQVIALRFDQSLTQDRNRNMTLDGDLMIGLAGVEMMPDRIENTIILDGEGVDIAALRAIHDQYDLLVAGRYDFEDGTAAIMVQGDTDMPSRMGAEGLSPVSFVTNLNGPTQNLTGDISMNASYKGENLNLTSDVAVTDTQIMLQNINGLSSDLKVAGNLSMPFKIALVDGEVSLATNNLNDLIILAGQDIPLTGSGRADITLYASEQTQGASLDGNFSNVAYDNLTLAGLAITTSDNNIMDQQWPAATVSLNNLSYDATQINVAKATLSMRQNGGYGIELTADGQNVQPFTVKANAAVLSLSPLAVSIDSARLQMQNGVITASGNVSETELSIQMNGEDIRLSAIPFVSLPESPVIINDIAVKATQTPQNPVIEGNAALTAQSDNAPQTQIATRFSYQNNQASLNANGTGEGIETLNAQASLPMTLSLYPFAFETGGSSPLNGSVAAVLDVASILPYVTDMPYDIGGRLEADANLSGRLDDIRYNGDGIIENGSFFDPITDLTLQDIEGGFSFDNEAVVIDQITASGADARGSLLLDGRIGLADLTSPVLDLSLDAQDIHILNGPPYDVRLNADVEFTGQGENYLLEGGLSLGEVTILLPENGPDPIPTLNIVEEEDEDITPFMERIRLDLNFVADNKIFIRGYGVDTEMAGEVTVTGFANDPQVNGELSSIRGRYEDFGRQFTLEQAVLRFQGSVPPSPYLDIIASVRIDDVDAKVNINGTPKDPEVGFSSQPPLPEDEVLSRILFGEDIRTISPFQAIQLANTLRRLSGQGGGGLNVLGSLRRATGLDDIRIEGSGEDTRVGAGKYISDDVYLDVTKGAGEESGAARVEVELTPSISLESKVGQTGESDTNIFWRWDY